MINRYHIQFTESGISHVDKQVASLGNTLNKQVNIATELKGALMSLGAAYIGLQGLKTTVNVIQEFESTMLEVKAVTKASATEFTALSAAARKMGAETRYSASESGQALLALAKIGFDTSQAIEALPTTLNLAIAGMLGIEQSAETVAITLKQFGLEVDQSTRVADVLVTAANAAATSVAGMSSAFANVGPVAKSASLSLESTAAAIEVLTNAGLSADMAGTSLKNILLGLSAPTDTAIKALESLGLTVEDISLKTNTFPQIFAKLKSAGMTLKESEALFGRLGVAGALALADMNTEIAKFTDENMKAAGAAKETADTMDSGLKKSFLELKSIIEEVMLKIGDAGLTQVLTGLVKFFTDTVKGIGILITQLGQLGEVIGRIYFAWNETMNAFIRLSGAAAFGVIQTFSEAFTFIFDFGYDVFSNLGTAIFELIHGGSKTKTVPQIFAENWEKSFTKIAQGWEVATKNIKKEAGNISSIWTEADFMGVYNTQAAITDTVKGQKKAVTDLTTAVIELSEAEKLRIKQLADAQELYGSFQIKPEGKSLIEVPTLAPVYTGAFSDTLNKQTEDIKTFADENADIIDTFSNNVSNSLSDMFTDVGASFSDFMDSLTKDIIRMMTSQYVGQFFSWLGGMGGGSSFSGFNTTGFGQYGSGVTDTLSGGTSYGLFGMAYAGGGSYEAGVPRITGERGWEIDVPSVNGRVLSHSDAIKAVSGGGQPVNVKILNNVDEGMILQALQTNAGEKLIMNTIMKHKNMIGGY